MYIIRLHIRNKNLESIQIITKKKVKIKMSKTFLYRRIHLVESAVQYS